MLKGSNRNTSKRFEISSKLTIKTPERRLWHRSGVFTVNFEHTSHLQYFYCFRIWAQDYYNIVQLVTLTFSMLLVHKRFWIVQWNMLNFRKCITSAVIFCPKLKRHNRYRHSKIKSRTTSRNNVNFGIKIIKVKNIFIKWKQLHVNTLVWVYLANFDLLFVPYTFDFSRYLWPNMQNMWHWDY